MQQHTKKPYLAPVVSPLGSVEEITGWFQGGAGEYFGGAKAAKVKCSKGAGPADFGKPIRSGPAPFSPHRCPLEH